MSRRRMHGNEVRPDAITDILLTQLQDNPAVGMTTLRNQAYVALGGVSTAWTAPATIAVLGLGGGATNTVGAGSFTVRSRMTGVFWGAVNINYKSTAAATDTVTWVVSSVSNTGTNTAATVFSGTATATGTTGMLPLGMAVYYANSNPTTGLAGLATSTLASISTMYIEVLNITTIGINNFKWSGLIYPTGTGAGTIFTPPPGQFQGAAASVGQVVGLVLSLAAGSTIQILNSNCVLMEWPFGAGVF